MVASAGLAISTAFPSGVATMLSAREGRIVDSLGAMPPPEILSGVILSPLPRLDSAIIVTSAVFLERM